MNVKRFRPHIVVAILQISTIEHNIAFTGPQIRVRNDFFLISQPKYMLWYSIEHTKHMFELMDKKIIANLR